MIRREAEWANQFSDKSTWWNAYVIMLLAEYKIATGDDSCTAGLHRLALDAAKGQSAVGSWGHNYALPSGILSGYGMMNAPGVPLTISLTMAREAGLKDPAVDLAINRSAKMLRFPHPGAPEPNGDSYRDWDATGGYLLALAMPLKKLLLTGKQPNTPPQIDAVTAGSLIADGRGWSNNDRYSAYDKLDPDTLLDKLGSWSPTVRERASIAISRRKGDKPIAAMVELLDSPNLFARYGACEVLILLKAAAAPAVPQLTALLNHEELWMRIKAAEALSNIGSPAMSSLPILLARLAQEPSQTDPRGMEQRYLCFSIFGALLKNSLDGVDRNLLRKAVAAGLRNENGRARSDIARVYKMLSFREIEPLLPAIPQLRQAAEIFDKGEGNFPQHMSVQKAADVRKAIAEIEATTNKPELWRIR